MQQASTNTSQRNWLDHLLAANASVTDPAQRHLHRLIALLTLGLPLTTLILFGVILAFRPAILDDPDTILLLSGGPLFLIGYFINRTGRNRLAAAIIIASTGLVTLTAPFLPSSTARVLTLTLLPSLLAALLLSPRASLIAAGVMTGSVILIVLVHPNLPGPFSQYFDMLLLLPPIQVAIGLFAYQMQRIEQIRRRELEATNDQLRESEMLLEQRVKQRTQELQLTNEKLAVALDQAEEANRLKSQFLASMSHELRTPLNAILNFNEMMMLGMVGDVSDQQKDLLSKSFDSAKHLLDLINDVLDISKMQGDMLTLFVEDDVDLSSELNKVMDAAGSLIKDREIKLVSDIDQSLPVISGDKRRIRQIMLNLIANAVKFTEEGTVTVSAKRKGDDVLFAVIDTGPGIPAEEQAVIFEPFIQTEAGIRHQGGTGLGLPISRRLTELHGGRLWVESEPGEGASFFVRLPVEMPESVRKPEAVHA